jgi:hypothetical protein
MLAAWGPTRQAVLTRQDGPVSATAPAPVVRADVVVRYVEVADELDQIRRAWPQLEAAVGSLRGRRFLAAFDPVAGWYRACVAVRADATSAEQALPEIVVPGGRYLRVRLRGDPPAVYDAIAPAYALLASSARRDDGRPSLEVYRRLDEVDVLMPVT